MSSALLDLNRTTIVAPTSGVIINKLVEPGNTVVARYWLPDDYTPPTPEEHYQQHLKAIEYLRSIGARRDEDA